MFSHGIIAGLLFGVVGRMVYDRTHTRDLGDLEKMGLSRTLPFASVTFVLAGLASMGMPGFSGFVAELQVLIGAWHAFPVMALLTGVGIIVGVAYTLRAVQRAFYADTVTVEAPEPLPPITVAERVGAALLLACTVLIGLFPGLLMELVVPCFGAPLFEGLQRGGLM
jgi:NADH-quinone oxidoreductase subunit M